MRILHTADWHLGKRLENLERTEEHRYFLEWLLQILQERHVDVLIIAGDIFDTGTPSNTALSLYYNFLSQLSRTPGLHTIITGGNHDSVSTLHAPKELLRHLRIHITGGIPEDPRDQILTLPGSDGKPALTICAVPFLRDRDIRISIPGESPGEREQRIVNGITEHYQNLAALLPDLNVPVIATGHLFAAGATASDSEKEILVGGLGQMPAGRFPELFDYIALGHLHRPQTVGGKDHIRYSGSPVPLSFSESEDKKQVLLVDFPEGRTPVITPLPVPGNRKLVRINGTLHTILEKIPSITRSADSAFPCWVEARIQTDQYIDNAETLIREAAAANPEIDAVLCRQIRNLPAQSLSELTEPAHTLSDLTPEFVFERKCAAVQMDNETQAEFMHTFREALVLMHQNHHEAARTS